MPEQTVENMTDDKHTMRVKNEYGNHSIERFAIFGSAGFINFGYWVTKPQQLDQLTMQDRNEASRELYRQLWREIDLFGKESIPCNILEVGCGTGAGLALLLEELGPALALRSTTVIGQDITPQQRQRTSERLRNSTKANIRVIEDLSEVESASVDVLFSVETLQCIQDLEGFVQQAARVLKPGSGNLALTMHLCPNQNRYDRLRELIPTCPSPDIMTPLPVLLEAFTHHASDFREVNVKSIGEFVFPAWGAWSKLVGEEESFSEEVVRAWREGALDYYTITARRTV